MYINHAALLLSTLSEQGARFYYATTSPSLQPLTYGLVGVVPFSLSLVHVRHMLQHASGDRIFGLQLTTEGAILDRKIALLIASGTSPSRTTTVVQPDLHALDHPITAAAAADRIIPQEVASDKEPVNQRRVLVRGRAVLRYPSGERERAQTVPAWGDPVHICFRGGPTKPESTIGSVPFSNRQLTECLVGRHISRFDV